MAAATARSTGRPWHESPVKRAADLVIAASLAVVAAPIVFLVAIGVRLRLGSPVLFRQQRAGRLGRAIVVTKFRSMTDETGPDGSLLSDDQRLTPFGRMLRSTSLDELPQLWSILSGDMSLIGPRPLPMAYVDRYSPRQRRRLEAKPGLTGWAQVHGRNAVDWPERLELDVEYVENSSWSMDLGILARTVAIVLRRRGVSADGVATMDEFVGQT